jgi:predicted esterase
MNRNLWLLFLGLPLVAVGAYVVRHRAAVAPGAPGETATDETVEAPTLAWCASGLEAIPGEGCYAAPPGTGPLPLVIYLHGIFEKGPLETEELDRQARVARKGVADGFAVLALRGAEGACATTPEYATKVCWPSNEKTADKGESFVLGWQPALRAAAQRHPFTQKYVFGFSNGGYFAGLIAVRSLYDADAFAVAGAGSVEPVKALGAKRPMLLLSANSDPSQEGMQRFDEELTREGWPHEHHAREGGHELPDPDIEAALTFFRHGLDPKPAERPAAALP